MAEIGATLREARMRAKIDINEVEVRTKIRAKYLRAIENEEWDLLPGDVYVKSFLRTYGDFLGVDSRQLIDDYKRRYNRPTDNEMRAITPLGRDRERHRRRRPRVPSWLAVVVVLAAVVVALYLVGHNKGSGTAATGTHATATTSTSHRRAHHAAAVKPRRATPTAVKLQLTPTGPGPVYVCLVDGTGKPRIPGQIFNVGDTIPTITAPKLMLTLGNASVKMRVNGTVVAVRPSSGAIGYELTPTAHKSLTASAQPRCA